MNPDSRTCFCLTMDLTALAPLISLLPLEKHKGSQKKKKKNPLSLTHTTPSRPLTTDLCCILFQLFPKQLRPGVRAKRNLGPYLQMRHVIRQTTSNQKQKRARKKLRLNASCRLLRCGGAAQNVCSAPRFDALHLHRLLPPLSL